MVVTVGKIETAWLTAAFQGMDGNGGMDGSCEWLWLIPSFPT